jgi:hypothetical protein
MYNGTIKLGDKRWTNYFKEHKLIPWYEWQCSNWGSKWNANCPERSGNSIWFMTPWGPPTEIIEKLYDISQELQLSFFFEYEESGLQVCGCFRDGEWEDYGSGGCRECRHCSWAEEYYAERDRIDELLENGYGCKVSMI